MEQKTIPLLFPITPEKELFEKYVNGRLIGGVACFVSRAGNLVYELDEQGNRTGNHVDYSITAEKTDFLTPNLAKEFVKSIQSYLDDYATACTKGFRSYHYDSRSIIQHIETIKQLHNEVIESEISNSVVILNDLEALLIKFQELLEIVVKEETDYLARQYKAEEQNTTVVAEKTALIDSLLTTYSKADSVLSGSTIDVVAIDNPDIQAPASTDGKTIQFNKAKLHNLTDMSNERLTELNGLNYHELSHILFSPRKNAEICKWARLNNLISPLQLLEDIRIELMMIRRYPSTKPFFEVTISNYILNDSPVFGERLFARIYGAKYLSLDVRQSVVDIIKQIVKHEDLLDIIDIVNKYQRIAYPKHTAEAKDLVKRFSKYFTIDELQNNSQMGCDDVSNMKHGAGESQTKQEQLTNKTDTDELDMSADSSSSSNDTDKESNSTDTSCSAPKPSDEFAQRNMQRELLKEKLKQFISTLNESKQVQEKNKELRKAITGETDYDNNLRQANYNCYTPKETYRNLANKFGNELEKIRTDLDPMWIQEVPSGRLNIQRAMKRDINSLDTLFDRWHEGSDSCDIEAVILLDNSSSMYSMMSETCQSAWVIKRGIERVNGDVTILSFNDRTYTIYDKETKATASYRGISSTGGTDPKNALDIAIQIFNKSRKQTKLLFIVTDGSWSNEVQNNVRVQMCNDLGVLTSLVFMTDGDSEYYDNYISSMPEHKFNHEVKHNCKYFNVVSNPKDLTKVAVDIVKAKLKEGYAR